MLRCDLRITHTLFHKQCVQNLGSKNILQHWLGFDSVLLCQASYNGRGGFCLYTYCCDWRGFHFVFEPAFRYQKPNREVRAALKTAFGIKVEQFIVIDSKLFGHFCNGIMFINECKNVVSCYLIIAHPYAPFKRGLYKTLYTIAKVKSSV